MKWSDRWLLTTLPLLLLAGGCATTQYNLGRKALDEKAYDTAMTHLVQSIRQGDHVFESTRDLGILFYEQGKFPTAQRVLEKAMAMDSTDGRSLLYMGATYEALAQYDRAIQTVRLFNRVSRFSEERAAIEAKLDELMQKKMTADAQQALSQEAMLDTRALSDSTVAVLYFTNLGDKRGLDPLQKGLAEMLITDLSKVPGIHVVERLRLNSMMQEMQLNQASLVDAATAPRLGRLLGASKIINGSFIDLSGRDLRIQAGLTATAGDAPSRNLQVQGAFTGLFELEKEMVFDLVDRMGISLTQAQRDDIGRIPTENILAFVAYSKGIDLEDRGLFDQAQTQYQRALSLDPSFNAVAQALTRTQVKAQGPVKLTTLSAPASKKSKSAQKQGQPQPQKKVADNKKLQMQHAGNVLNQRFLPGVDARAPQQEQQASTLGDASIIHMIIPLTGLE